MSTITTTAILASMGLPVTPPDPGTTAHQWLTDIAANLAATLHVTHEDDGTTHIDLTQHPTLDDAYHVARSCVPPTTTDKAWIIVAELRAWACVDWESILLTGTHGNGRAGLLMPDEPEQLAIVIHDALAERMARTIQQQCPWVVPATDTHPEEAEHHA